MDEKKSMVAINNSDKIIKEIISSISIANIERWINKITSFHTRHSKSKFIDKVSFWLKTELEKNGQTDVRFHHYTENGFNLKNVICHIRGLSDKVILICAHYDSRMENLDDSRSRAPGADDNASGMSVILEISRVIANLQFEYSIQLVFFSGEEQGQWGSKHYAKFIKDNNIPLQRLINLDMVGYSSRDNYDCVVERDIGNSNISNDQYSEVFAQSIEEIVKLNTTINTMPGPIYDSDYMPFEALGYVVAGLYDGGAENYPYYHSSKDESVYLNTKYVAEIAKIILVALLKEGKIIKI
jgi:Zn-dependent M28 family amino/carboxypeptidase